MSNELTQQIEFISIVELFQDELSAFLYNT